MAAHFLIPTPDDAGRIARLHVASWREAYRGIVPDAILDGVDMAERIAAWQGHLAGGGITFLAEVDGVAAGFIRAGALSEPLVAGADGHIFALYVLRRFHRRGLGRGLIGRAAAAFVAGGGRALSVGVLSANQPARAFYAALGARLAREEVYHWDGHALDECIYLFENPRELAGFA